MAIKFTCPHCAKLIKCKESLAGSPAKCPGCDNPLTVPSLERLAPETTSSIQGRVASPIFDMTGRFCRLLVYEHKVEITRFGIGGVLLHGLKGVKSIPYLSITAIQFKRATMLTAGYIQFTIHGGRESKKGLFDAVTDENTFLFAQDRDSFWPSCTKSNQLASQIAQYVESRLHAGQKVSQSGESLSSELQRLAELAASGALSEEEFRLAKRRLIE